MAADNSVVAKVEAPALKPLALKSRLAPTPANPPKYSVKVKNLAGQDVVVADPRATRALVALMNVHAVVGGAACHWGGPAAFAEINAAIHALMFGVQGRQWHEAYNYINDAGHAENGVYALRANYGFDNMKLEDLKGFRSVKSKLTGHGESHLNPEGVLLSNGPLSSSLPQAQGLAIADKLIGNDRVTICVMSDGASMEGEAKEAFAAIPGLAAKDRVNPFVMVISDNDTKLSGRITKDSFSMQRSFQSLGALGWNVISVPTGHDLQAVYQAIEKGIQQAKANPNVPVCLWVKTIKGYGIKSTEENSAGGHGFPLANGEKVGDWVTELYKDATAPEELVNWAKSLRADWEKKEAEKKAKAAAAPAAAAPSVKKDKVQAGLAAGAIRAAKDGYPVYSVSSDVQGSTGISTFQKATDRYLDVGIAEANMVSVATGLSKAGFVTIVDTFGQFGVTKGNLPLTMAALSQAPVIAMFSHVGFQDAADGASHQATTYFAALSAIPHTVVIAPSCSNEAEALMYEAIKRQAEDRKAGKDGESYIFFVGRENYPIYWLDGANYPWGKAQVTQEGSDVVLIGCGTLFSKAVEAGKLLAAKGVKATVINNPFVNRVDLETIGAAVKKCGKVVTIEDHQVVCGMGSQISHALSTAGIPHVMKSLGIHDEFGQSAYLAEELYQMHGMTGPKMAEAALALLGK
ncbi:MAG TPA: transketolase C-terminal domain-containing protein [Candidatus Paceibacterota bacterium]|nr:transketolase C-terminal domain-containing protein [Candidatus Paceibacterota bacterium]